MTGAFAASGLLGDLLRDPEIAAEFGSAAQIARMIAFERAWTDTVLGADPAALAAIDAFAPDMARLAASGATDGVPVPELVRQLRRAAGDAADAIHSGATSQDVLDTATVLTLGAVFDFYEARLAHVIGALDDLASRFGEAPLTARTRMQAAIPATAGHRIGAWLRPLRDRKAALDTTRAAALRIQAGGPAGLREIGDDAAARLAAALGLAPAPVWHSDRAPILAAGHWMTLTAGALGKIGQDIALMAQQGIDEIALSGGGGSSAMPHKSNPVLAETLVALARYVAGQNGVLAQSLVHEQERSGAAWTLEWLVLPAMAEATGAALRHAAALLGSVERIGDPAP